MENIYESILRGVIAYEGKKSGILYTLIVIAVAVMILILFLNYGKTKKMDKIISILVVVILILCIPVNAVIKENQSRMMMCDNKNIDYIYYSGAFTHDDYQKDSFYHNVYIIDGNGEKVILKYPDYSNTYSLHEDPFCMPVGSFDGDIVYSNKSKIIVFWQLNTT